LPTSKCTKIFANASSSGQPVTAPTQLSLIPDNPNLKLHQAQASPFATRYDDELCCQLPVGGMTNLVSFLEHTEPYRRDLRRVEYGDERDPKMRFMERIAPMTIDKDYEAHSRRRRPERSACSGERVAADDEKLRGSGAPVCPSRKR
jgi:hypothetical protein